jgi:hypothetical protein
VNLNTNMTQSKVLDQLLDELLEEEIFLRPRFFKLPLERCFREEISRVMLEML